MMKTVLVPLRVSMPRVGCPRYGCSDGNSAPQFWAWRGRIAPATTRSALAARTALPPSQCFPQTHFKPCVSFDHSTKSNSSPALRLRTGSQAARCEPIRMQSRTVCDSRLILRSGNLLDLPTTSGRIGCFSGDFQLFVAFDSRAVSKWRQTLSVT